MQPTKVFVTDAPVTPVAGLGTTTGVGNVVPSTSATFTTLNGLVRDNPRGNETQDLPADGDNNNLRAVSRLDPPLMDAATGDGGLTRYRALTRDSAPLDAVHTTPNPVTIGREFAGAYGWGQNLYVPNAVDLPSFAESVSNASSQRSEWLNPSPANGDASNWKTDNLYIPPAVTITLTPRYMALTQSRNAFGRNRQYLRNPTNGGAIAQETVYRYTYEQGGALANPPTLGIDDNDGNAATPPAGVPAAKFAGYPATKAGVDGILNTADDTQYYDGDFIIFAEGNVRIKGTVGGFDPETGQTFVRRLTVVTNGTVYFDGSLLRDNISPELATNNPVRASAKGKSTIAVLAKNYAAVNTTQFLAASLPAATASDDRVAELGVPTVVQLSTDPAGPKRQQQFGLTLGPVTAYDVNGLPFIPNVYNAAAAVDMNQTPSYLTTLNSPTPLSLLARHAPSNSNSTAVNLLINSFLNGALLEPNVFKAWTPIPSFPLVLGDPPATTLYTSNVYNLNPAPGDPNADYLFPTNGFPYTATGGGNANNMPAVGITNNLTLQFDPSSDKAKVDYNLSRFGVVPLDIRIEALIYAQEGSFFIIPGPWFNPNPSDTYAQFVANGNRRPGETGAANSSPSFVDPRFPFYGDPLDIRITMFGAITENLPAEVGDQGAWLQKWGWVPKYYGSTGLAGTPTQGTTIPTFHGSVRRDGTYQSGNGGGGVGANDGIGNGITYIYDSRLSSPYDANGLPLRTNPNFGGVPGTQSEPLPPMPRLPVAPGLLYYGERPIR
ncbi:MAG: hypothetical protein H7145_22405 [Akkermansiaceae bacterium]|nr:hypothetical protein [Armatimonadota bacterium]